MVLVYVGLRLIYVRMLLWFTYVSLSLKRDVNQRNVMQTLPWASRGPGCSLIGDCIRSFTKELIG